MRTINLTISRNGQSSQNGVVVRPVDIFPDRQTTAYYDYEVPNYYHIDYVYIQADGKIWNGGRQAPLLLSADDWKFIRAIQPLDADIQPKMNWLGEGAAQGKGRPCWVDGNGYKADSMYYGLSPVRVRMDTGIIKDFKFPAMPKGTTVPATFYKLEHFKRAMKDMELGEPTDYTYKWIDRGVEKQVQTRIRRGVIPLIEQGYINVCSEHQLGQKVSVTERGVKLFPVFDPDEGAQYKGDYRIWLP